MKKCKTCELPKRMIAKGKRDMHSTGKKPRYIARKNPDGTFSKGVLEFRSYNIKLYLDEKIEFWRKKESEAQEECEKVTASCYIDAYQLVRCDMFGEPKE